MKRSEAAKYARWSAATALLLAGITGAVYIERGWQRLVEKQQAPPPAPVNVERQSTALTFSKVEQDRTIFTVEASKSTDFRGENVSLLEDVKITLFGKASERHDVLHTQSCRYSKDKGSITCAGAVQIDLLSAAEAANTQGQQGQADVRGIHVETKGVTFDRASGLAKTDQPVVFRFPNGEGNAAGVEYRSDEGTLRLEKDVFVKLRPTPEQSKKVTRAPEEVEIRGSQLTFGRDSRSMQLLGPASAETSQGRLIAGEFQMLLDDDFHPKLLSAKPGNSGARPEVSVHNKQSQEAMNADLITASFAPSGWVQKISAQGNVHGASQSPDRKGDWKAESAKLDLWPKVNQPRALSLRGGVVLRLESVKSADSRELTTEALRAVFSEGTGKEGSRIQRVETLAPGSMLWKETLASSGEHQQTKLQADKLALDFAATGKASRLEANGNVQTERFTEGRPGQTASAKTGSVELGEGGGWSQMQLDGGVRLKQGECTALADHALYVRAEQTVVLTGHAVVRDATTQTTAAKFTFHQRTGEVSAEKGVKSTDLSAKSRTVDLAPVPANITADQLQADSRSGRARYTGHARFWQGESVMEADAIELLRESRSMLATGSVRAVFPQGTATKTNRGAGKGPTLWHVSAGTLTYWDKENKAHLEKNVVIESAGGRMRSAGMDLYFTRAGTLTAGTSNSPTGSQQLSRAVATGGVVVEQGARRATAEQGDYSAAEGKFVMSGGTPTIFDASSGTTTGRQLTFFLADDTIIVDSENGSRTLTKHRVE